jgi:hypothetical protein
MSDNQVDRAERIITSRDKQVGLRLPLAIDQRLDALMGRAIDAGERTTRRELVAAIILAAEPNGDEVGRLLKNYRRATVGDALLDVEPTNVAYISHKPGPRVVR